MSSSKITHPNETGHEKEVEDDSQEESNQLYPTTGPEAPTTGPEIDEERRDFLKGLGATGAAVGLGATSQTKAAQSVLDSVTEDAEAIVPLVVGTMAVVLTGQAAASAIKRNLMHDSGGGSAGSTLWDTIYENAILEARDISQQVNDAYDELDQTAALARSEAKTKAAKKIAAGGTESEASSEAINKIDEYYSGVHDAFYTCQENIIYHLETWVSQIASTEGVSVTDVFNVPFVEDGNDNYGTNPFYFFDQEVELPSGETKTYRNAVFRFEDVSLSTYQHEQVGFYGESARPGNYDYSSTELSESRYPSSDFQGDIVATPSYSSDTVSLWDFSKAGAGLSTKAFDDEIDAQRDAAVSDVNTIISDLFANYSGEELQDVADQLQSPIDRLINATNDWSETGSDAYAQMIAYELGYETSATGHSLEINYDSDLSGTSTQYSTTSDFESVYDSGASTSDTTLTNDEIYIDGDGSGAGRYSSTSDFAATEISFEVASTTGTVQVTTFDSSGSAGPSATTDTTGTLTVGDGSTEMQSFSLAVGDGSADGTATITSFTVSSGVDTGVYAEYQTTSELDPIVDTGINGNSGDITISNDSVTVDASSDQSMVSAVAGDFPSSSVTGFTPGTTATLDFESLPSSGSIEVEVWDDVGNSIEVVTVEEAGPHEFGDGSATIWRIDVTVPLSGESVVINSYTLSTSGGSEINGEIISGFMFGWRPAKGTLATGDEYYVSNLSSTPKFMKKKEDGSLEQMELSTGGFRITEIISDNGDSVDSVNVYGTTHTSSDTSGLIEQLNEAIATRKEQDDDASSSTGTGGSVSWTNLLSIGGIVTLILYLINEKRDE
jgi:hypothetical protein